MADDTQKDFELPERPKKYDGYKMNSGYTQVSSLTDVDVDMEALADLYKVDPVAAKEQAIDALKQMQPIPQQLDNAMTLDEIDQQLRYATPQFWIKTDNLTPTQVRYIRELLRRYGVGESTSDMEQVDVKVDGTFVYNEDGLTEAMDKLNIDTVDNMDAIEAVDKLTELSPDDMIPLNRNMENNSDG